MRYRTALVALALTGAFSVAACRDAAGPQPPGIASVVVTSATDSILDLDRTAQLSAVARDGSGNALPAVQFAWTTSAPGIVNVSAQGMAFPQSAGTATVTATPVGGGGGGALRLRVVQADLDGVTTFATDAYGGALVAGLTAAQLPAVQAVWAACASNAGGGNITAVTACTAALRSAAAAALDPTDRALLEILGLYAYHIEQRLGL